MKIGKPVFKAMAEAKPDYISSDCQLAGHHIEQGIAQMTAVQEAAGTEGAKAPQMEHPLSLLRIAYGL